MRSPAVWCGSQHAWVRHHAQRNGQASWLACVCESMRTSSVHLEARRNGRTKQGQALACQPAAQGGETRAIEAQGGITKRLPAGQVVDACALSRGYTGRTQGQRLGDQTSHNESKATRPREEREEQIGKDLVRNDAMPVLRIASSPVSRPLRNQTLISNSTAPPLDLISPHRLTNKQEQQRNVTHKHTVISLFASRCLRFQYMYIALVLYIYFWTGLMRDLLLISSLSYQCSPPSHDYYYALAAPSFACIVWSCKNSRGRYLPSTQASSYAPVSALSSCVGYLKRKEQRRKNR